MIVSGNPLDPLGDTKKDYQYITTKDVWISREEYERLRPENKDEIEPLDKIRTNKETTRTFHTDFLASQVITESDKPLAFWKKIKQYAGESRGETRIDIDKFRVNGSLNEFAGFKVVDGNSYIIAQSVAFMSNEIPDEYSLSQNYPNPFNPSTNIPFALPFESNVKISIYDVQGRLVQELVNSHFNSGYHNISWDASHLASGLYFIQFESSSFENSESFSTIQKSLLVK